MTTLDLHIGLHKTGTTSLQAFLAANPRALGKHGIIYPETGREGAGHHLLVQAAKCESSGQELLAQIARESIGFERTIVSSEVLSAYFLYPELLDRFCRASRQHFHLRVILYLRRQDELKESVFAQVARDWYRGDIAGENHFEYDHLQRLRLLETQFGEDDLIVRLHSSKRAVEDDFLSIYGLDADEGFVRTPRSNIAFNRRLTLFLSRLDKTRFESPDLFGQYLGERAIFADDGRFGVLAPEERRAFLSQFEASNREVAERYFPELNGKLFPEPEDETDWSPPEPVTEQEMQILLATLWKDYAEQRERLKKFDRATSAISPMALWRFLRTRIAARKRTVRSAASARLRRLQAPSNRITQL